MAPCTGTGEEALVLVSESTEETEPTGLMMTSWTDESDSESDEYWRSQMIGLDACGGDSGVVTSLPGSKGDVRLLFFLLIMMVKF